MGPPGAPNYTLCYSLKTLTLLYQLLMFPEEGECWCRTGGDYQIKEHHADTQCCVEKRVVCEINLRKTKEDISLKDAFSQLGSSWCA